MSIINIFSDLTKSPGSGFGTSVLSWKNIQEGIRFFESLPTPEESLIEAKRQESELKNTISKIKEKLYEIENEMKHQDVLEEELEDLYDSSNYLKTQLENYEAEYEYVKEQAIMFNSIANENDDDFIENIPTFYDAMKNSVDKKIKDVKEAISIIKKNKRNLEICVECKKQIRDEKGRKASIKHYHINLLSFENIHIKVYENEEFIYNPVICESCFENEALNDNDYEKIVVKTCSKAEVDYGYDVNFDKKILIELSKKYLTYIEEITEIDNVKYKEKLVKSENEDEENTMNEKETLKYFIDFFKSISDVCDCEECIANKEKKSIKYVKLKEILEEKENKIEVIEN
jgi:hypothetical protein